MPSQTLEICLSCSKSSNSSSSSIPFIIFSASFCSHETEKYYFLPSSWQTRADLSISISFKWRPLITLRPVLCWIRGSRYLKYKPVCNNRTTWTLSVNPVRGNYIDSWARSAFSSLGSHLLHNTFILYSLPTLEQGYAWNVTQAAGDLYPRGESLFIAIIMVAAYQVLQQTDFL